MTNDTDVIDQPRPTTRRDLATLGLDALDKQRAGEIAVSRSAGGVSFATAVEVMEFAKLMSLAGAAVPKDFRNNPGMCLAVAFQAIEWRMSPFQVANKAYVVNDRLGFESQLIHAVIEARAPLQHRLECDYEGEGPDRVCVVTGHFTNGDAREYRSPKIGTIKIKNSPLWHSDPDQQLWYYSSRSWARKWCPDVLMGIYTREELAENPQLGRESDDRVIEGSGLHQRLAGSEVSRDEGHRPGHVDSELDQIGTTGDRPATEATEPRQEPQGEAQTTKPGGKGSRRTKRRDPEQPHGQDDHENQPSDPAESTPDRPAADQQQPAGASVTDKPPRNAEEYREYSARWMIDCQDPATLTARWKNEIKLRNDCGITADELAPIRENYAHRLEQLS